MRARRAVPDDAPAIARAHVASWNATYRGVIADDALDSLTEERLAPEWRQEIETGGAGVAFYRALGFTPDGRDDKLCIGAPEYRFRGALPV